MKNTHFRYKDWSNGEFETPSEEVETMALRDEINTYLEELDENVLLMDGFDEALIGFAERINTPLIAIYDWNKMVEVLMTRDGMEYEEAVEYISYNCLGAWVGERTPLIMMFPFPHRDA